jgi:acyl dehydratase
VSIKTTFDELGTLAGADLGASDWITVSQDRINTFADATDDHQWIHVNQEKAKAGPFGTTIAHGYLTLSLLIPLWAQLLQVEGVSMVINYGLNKVRFPAPVPAGARIRLTGKLAGVEKVGENGLQVSADLTVEIEGGGKPACAAQALFRFYG